MVSVKAAGKRKWRILLRSLLIPAVGVAVLCWVTWRQVQQERQRRPLFDGIAAGDLSKVRAALDAGADPNARDRPGMPTNLIALFKRMLHPRSDPDENYPTALMSAVTTSHFSLAEVLLDRGANVRAAGPNGDTALHLAVKWNDPNCAELLLRKGAKINKRNGAGETPLIRAVRNQNGEVTRLLTRYGALTNVPDGNGYSAIYHAAELGLPDLYLPLLEHGADPNTRDSNGNPLITRAVESCRPDLVLLLSKSRADPNARDHAGLAPLLAALRLSHRDRWDQLGITPKSRLSIIKQLLDSGANPNVTDQDGRSAIWVAVRNELLNEAELLLAAGANPNQAYPGCTPLIQAASQRNPEMVKLLLKYRADPNLKGEGGATGLMIAAYNADRDIVRAMLHAGARPQLADSEGLTAVQHAAGSPDIQNALRVAAVGAVNRRPVAN